jgi:PTS system nitrogen regulatory IIA component
MEDTTGSNRISSEIHRIEGNEMKLRNYLKGDRVIPDLQAKDKGSVLRELAQTLVVPCQAESTESLVQVLQEREKLESTGIGEGVAIPHGRLKGLQDFVLAFGRSVKGMDFDSIDHKPTHLFFLVMAPENSAVNNLKLLSRIVTLLKDSSFKKRLMEASTSQELFQFISEEDEKY